GRVVVLTGLAVHRELDLQLVRVADLVRGNDAGTKRLEAVESLAQIAPEAAGRDVNPGRVAEDVAHRLTLVQVPALLTDDRHELSLVMADGEFVGRQDGGAARVHHSFGRDEEAVYRQGRVARVLAVVGG